MISVEYRRPRSQILLCLLPLIKSQGEDLAYLLDLRIAVDNVAVDDCVAV